MRHHLNGEGSYPLPSFPFLLGGTFIEAKVVNVVKPICGLTFPFLLGGTFIEAHELNYLSNQAIIFPSFWEGLSLRLKKSTI